MAVKMGYVHQQQENAGEVNEVRIAVSEGDINQVRSDRVICEELSHNGANFHIAFELPGCTEILNHRLRGIESLGGTLSQLAQNRPREQNPQPSETENNFLATRVGHSHELASW